MRRLPGSTLMLLALAFLARDAGALPVIPPEFIQETRATGLNGPVNFDFLPDGRVLVVERVSGRIRLARAAGADADTVGTVPDLRTSGDSGLLGIAVDALWPNRPYVYVQYDAASTFNLKVVRYTLTGDLDGSGDGRLALDPASRREILPDLPDDYNVHNGGTLAFGPDGKLYVALGDDNVSCSAQDLHQLRGKILRLKVDGLPAGGGPAPSYNDLGPLDNPFASDPDPRARLVWQYGLRNPWSFDFDPVTRVIAIADVGEASWEEIDVTGYAGRNFGWPFFEGEAPFNFDCDHPDFTNLTPPSYEYFHDTGRTVILGGVCYHPPLLPSGFPQEYWGQVFFLDFFSGRLSRLTCENGTCALSPPVAGQPDSTAWGTGFAFVPRMRFGPDAMLWYVQGTELRRISHPGVIGVPGADPAAGAVTLRAYPQPSRGPLTFESSDPAGGRIGIYDLAGRCVRTLALPSAGAGVARATWDRHDDAGRTVQGGVFFARLTTATQRVTRRLVLL